MAKLSARGRTELARVEKTVQSPETESCYCKGENADCLSCKGTNVRPTSTTQSRYTYALMSDGNVLKKVDVVFRNDQPISPWESKNRDKHSYGWTVFAKSKTKDAEKFVAIFEKRGYKKA